MNQVFTYHCADGTSYEGRIFLTEDYVDIKGRRFRRFLKPEFEDVEKRRAEYAKHPDHDGSRLAACFEARQIGLLDP